MKKVKKDLTGNRFGKLVVLKFKEKIGNQNKWLCQCDCGNKKYIFQSNLVGGQKSCGCIKKNVIKTHGFSNTRLYNIHSKLLQRCLNPNNNQFFRYGLIGRGICEEWKKFENFKNDMYESYLKHCEEFGEKNTSIDRIDNNKGYFKENCRWATHKEQSNNIKNNIKVEFNGRSLGLDEFCKLNNFNYNNIYYKINNGYLIEDIINKKPNKSIIKFEKYLNLYKENFNKLPERSQKILNFRFNLDKNGYKTCEEIGKIFNLTPKRILQIQKEALELLPNL